MKDYRAAAADEAEATPPMAITAVRSSPDPSLRLLDGKREALERECRIGPAHVRPPLEATHALSERRVVPAAKFWRTKPSSSMRRMMRRWRGLTRNRVGLH